MATPPTLPSKSSSSTTARPRQTVARDLERAIALLISLESDEARERVAVYMDGLAQMRSEWGVATAAASTARSPRPPESPRRR